MADDAGRQSGAAPQPEGARRPRRARPAAAQAGASPAKPTLAGKPAAKTKEGPKYSFHDKEQVDYIREATKKNVWYYRDRLNVARGPCTLPVMRECWVHGIIDEDTLVWGQGLHDFLPVRNVRTLVPQIRTVEVRVATWVKKQFALKPALNSIRKHREDQRPKPSAQVDTMF